MTKITFLEYLQKQNRLLSDLESRMVVTKEGEKYFKELINLHPSLEIAYNHEISQILKNLKVNEKYTELIIEVEKDLKKVKNYKLDLAGQKVLITDKNNKDSEFQTITAPHFVENELLIPKDNPYYYSILSYFCQIDRFEILQLSVALKQLT